MEETRNKPLIGIVGVCASGKSTLTSGLRMLGYNCRHIAQEHSYVPDMWKRMTGAEILIFLEVNYETTLLRKNLNWSISEYQEQLFRLRNAFDKATIRIKTDTLTPSQLIEEAERQIFRVNNKP